MHKNTTKKIVVKSNAAQNRFLKQPMTYIIKLQSNSKS